MLDHSKRAVFFLALYSLLFVLSAAAEPAASHENLQTLVPSLHPTVDPTSLHHLQAKMSAELFYTHDESDPLARAGYALVQLDKTKYPTINLDNSAHAISTVCDGNICTFTFSNAKALETVVHNWKVLDAKSHAGVVIATSLVDFATSHDAEDREYLLVVSIKDVHSSSAPFSFKGIYRRLSFEDTVHGDDEVTVKIGHGTVPRTSHPHAGRQVDEPHLLERDHDEVDAKSKLRRRSLLRLRSHEVQARQADTEDLLKGPLSFQGSADNTGTPWGVPGRLLSQISGNQVAPGLTGTVSIYCVGCSFGGALNWDSSITFSFSRDPIRIILTANGNAHAGFGLGINAGFHFEYAPPPIELFRISLTGFAVNNIISVGPALALQAGYKFGASATGSFLVGVDLVWQSVSLNWNVLSPSSSMANGWTTPRVTPRQPLAAGSVQIDASLYVNARIEFGINIGSGKLQATLSLNDKPTLTVSAKYSQQQPQSRCKNQIEIDASVTNALYVEAVAPAISTKDFTILDNTIWKLSPPICISP